MTVNVLIVDDSAFFRKRLCDILGTVSNIKVIGTANNGKEAIEQAARLKPDVITMDYEMPVMDGITAIKHIMADNPCPILMFSSLTYEGARVTLDALEAGAVDFLPKNFEDIARDASKMQEVLKTRILSLVRKPTPLPGVSKSTPSPELKSRLQSKAMNANQRTAEIARNQKTIANTSKRNESRHAIDILVIGTSTGGPVALQKILAKLPATFPVPILLIQHMPATFTPAFAERLNSLCQLTVKQADDGDELRAGSAYLAPGGQQMLVGKRGGRAQLSILPGDERLTYKPSVDLTFGSVAKTFPGKALSVVLTGMGADGKEGARMLKAGGSTVWTQSEKTCVVYGMPMAVDKAGFSDKSLDIDDVAQHILNRLS